jgi:hypothetical protein
VTEKGAGGVRNFLQKNDMDKSDKGEEINLMEYVSNNGEKWVTEKGAGGVRNFCRKMIWMKVIRVKR